LDGTKLRASASRHKAMSYDRLGPRIDEIKAQVAAMLAEAEAVDRAEDEEFGEDRRGDELPKELATREGRLARMRAAKEAIEAEAREKAATQVATEVAGNGGDESAIEEAAEQAAAKATPSKKAQRSFTDPESRMMKTTDGFHYAYNAQTVVDETSQVVLAAEVTNQAADVNELTEMIAVTEHNLDAADIDTSPEMILADAGYCSEAIWLGSPIPGPTSSWPPGGSRTQSGCPTPPGDGSPPTPPNANAWGDGSGPSRDASTMPDARPSSSPLSGR
jgi:hypothetical protein